MTNLPVSEIPTAKTAQERMPLVKAVDVCKTFGDFQALKSVSLDVERGEVVCIIGPSGSGKSALLRCINQLERIDSGAIWVDSELIGYRREGNKLHELRDPDIARQSRPIGMVFQRFNLFPHLTAIQSITEGSLQVLKQNPAKAREKPRNCWPRSGYRSSAMPAPMNCRAGSSSVSPLPVASP